MRLTEGESQISDYLQAFLSAPRKNYFHEKLLTHYSDESSESGGIELDLQQVTDCLCFVCDEFFRKFFYFLRSQGQSLEVDDIPELSDAFVDMFTIKQVKIGDKTHKVSEMVDWEDQMEMLLLEANIIVLADHKIGLDAVADLARTAVVNDLEPVDQMGLIETFRDEVKGRIESLVGLEDYQLEELHDRTNHYCDNIFPLDCQEFADPFACLAIWVKEISEFVSENCTDFKSFLMDLDRIEQACFKILSSHDGLIEKHSEFLRKFVKSTSHVYPGPTVQELREALVKLWLKEHMDEQMQANGQIPIEEVQRDETNSKNLN